MTDTPANISDDLYARLRKQFFEEQLMQLGAQIAFENYRARWNRIFNVESDNLCTPQPNCAVFRLVNSATRLYSRLFQ
jgi:hypothetical protein